MPFGREPVSGASHFLSGVRARVRACDETMSFVREPVSVAESFPAFVRAVSGWRDRVLPSHGGYVQFGGCCFALEVFHGPSFDAARAGRPHGGRGSLCAGLGNRDPDDRLRPGHLRQGPAHAEDGGQADHRHRQARLRAVVQGRHPGQRQGLRERGGVRDRQAARLRKQRDHLGHGEVRLRVRPRRQAVRPRLQPGLRHPRPGQGRRLQRRLLHGQAGRGRAGRLQGRLRDGPGEPEGRQDRRSGRHHLACRRSRTSSSPRPS